MPLEPTSLQRQQHSFAYLREHASHAHIAGDGLLVNLLCHTGLDQARRLAEEKKLLLPLADLAWMPILALYWMINPHERYIVAEIIKKLPCINDEDANISKWLSMHSDLIEQPLAWSNELFDKLAALPWGDFSASRSTEFETIISHLIELAWFRSPAEGNWEKVAEAWQNGGPAWATDMIRSLQARLQVQTRLTAPNAKCPLFPESAASDIRQHSNFAELWLLQLQGRRNQVCELVEKLTPGVSADSHQWRVLGDFARWGETFGEKGESETVYLARRRRISADTPLLLFHDKRQQRMDDLLRDLFRSQKEAMASERWEVFMLAMLHELSALRLWDIGMWRESIRGQAEGLIESMQWTNKHPGLAAHGLILSVRGFTARDPSKDLMTRRVIDVLEFAPTEVLDELAEGLLATYPLQKHRNAGLLDDITDLLPKSAWPELAKWTVSYADEMNMEQTLGWRSSPSLHWLHALLSLEPDSPVWETLQIETMSMARVSHHWLSGKQKGFLQRWLKCAPASLAREVGEAMMSVPETNSTVRISRAELLIEFEESHPELKGTFTRRLIISASSPNERLRLARHLADPDVAARNEAQHQRIVTLIQDAVERAVPAPGVTPSEIQTPIGVDLVESWGIEDIHILELLIAAINSPTVVPEYLLWLIDVVQLMVSNGPSEFAEIAKPQVEAWTSCLPKGRSFYPDQTGPFSTLHIGSQNPEEITLVLGRVHTIEEPRQ